MMIMMMMVVMTVLVVHYQVGKAKNYEHRVAGSLTKPAMPSKRSDVDAVTDHISSGLKALCIASMVIVSSFIEMSFCCFCRAGSDDSGLG